jgi:hypothetical protein
MVLFNDKKSTLKIVTYFFQEIFFSEAYGVKMVSNIIKFITCFVKIAQLLKKLKWDTRTHTHTSTHRQRHTDTDTQRIAYS